MDNTGARSQSIEDWRTAYKTAGMAALVHNGRKGKVGQPSVFSTTEHQKIGAKLKDPHNGLAGYVELQQWIEKEFKRK